MGFGDGAKMRREKRRLAWEAPTFRPWSRKHTTATMRRWAQSLWGRKAAPVSNAPPRCPFEYLWTAGAAFSKGHFSVYTGRWMEPASAFVVSESLPRAFVKEREGFL